MSVPTLDIAIWNYDRAAALRDGSVKIDGADVTWHSGRIVTEIFARMVKDRAYDVAELGLTYFLRTFEADEPPFLLMPVFPVRSFRHSAIYINKSAGIERPQDLNGKTIGEMALYGHDAGVMPKGMLSDEFGFKPHTCRWVVGGIDFPLNNLDFLPRPHPADVEVRFAKADEDLGDMLERGEIDALISADAPKSVLAGSAKVGRLFENYEEVERDYFRRTGIFPIMHAVAVKKTLSERHPELVKAVYAGFCAAKDAAEQQYVKGMTFNNMTLMIPWLSQLLTENRALLGNDWWPYGIRANRKPLDAFLRYHFEQGLSQRRLTIEDVFVPELLST